MVDLNIASPKSVLEGTRDRSGRGLPVEEFTQAQLIPHIWLLAERGPEVMFVSGGTQAAQVFGSETFNVNGEFATHQTPLAVGTFGAGAGAFIRRIRPGAAAESKTALYLEVIPAEVNGTIVNKVIVHDSVEEGTVFVNGVAENYRLGGTFEDEDETDPAKALGYLGNDGSNDNYAQSSKLYKVFSAQSVDFGEYYNRFSIRLLAESTIRNNASNYNLSKKIGHYVYTLQVISTDPLTGAKSIVSSLSGDSTASVVLAENIKHPNYGSSLSLGDVLKEQYDLFAEIEVEYDGIGQLNEDLKTGGTFQDNNGNDYTIDPIVSDNTLNLVNGVDVAGVAAASYMVSNSGKLTSGLKLTGGNDGILKIGQTYEGKRVSRTYRDIVNNMLLEYAVLTDIDSMSLGVSQYLDRARFVFRDVVDTGFSLSVKLKLGIFSGIRKDVNTWFTTFEALPSFEPGDHSPSSLDLTERDALRTEWEAIGLSEQEIEAKFTALQNSGMPTNIFDYSDKNIGTQLTTGQESAVLAAIKQANGIYSESEVYGTAPIRISVQQQSGKVKGSTYPYLQPLLLETFFEYANFMGAADGKWKPGLDPDISPANQISSFDVSTVNSIHRPQDVYDTDYENGAMWAQSYSPTTLFVPVQRTIYPDSTSILGSLTTSKAIGTIEVICDSVWRDLVGNSKLTDEQFLERSNEYIIQRLNGLFNGRYELTAKTYYTAADEQRGYSWSCTIGIYGSVGKLIGRYTVEAFRLIDFNPGGN